MDSLGPLPFLGDFYCHKSRSNLVIGTSVLKVNEGSDRENWFNAPGLRLCPGPNVTYESFINNLLTYLLYYFIPFLTVLLPTIVLFCPVLSRVTSVEIVVY